MGQWHLGEIRLKSYCTYLLYIYTHCIQETVAYTNTHTHSLFLTNTRRLCFFRPCEMVLVKKLSCHCPPLHWFLPDWTYIWTIFPLFNVPVHCNYGTSDYKTMFHPLFIIEKEKKKKKIFSLFLKTNHFYCTKTWKKSSIYMYSLLFQNTWKETKTD